MSTNKELHRIRTSLRLTGALAAVLAIATFVIPHTASESRASDHPFTLSPSNIEHFAVLIYVRMFRRPPGGYDSDRVNAWADDALRFSQRVIDAQYQAARATHLAPMRSPLFNPTHSLSSSTSH